MSRRRSVPDLITQLDAQCDKLSWWCWCVYLVCGGALQCPAAGSSMISSPNFTDDATLNNATSYHCIWTFECARPSGRRGGASTVLQFVAFDQDFPVDCNTNFVEIREGTVDVTNLR